MDPRLLHRIGLLPGGVGVVDARASSGSPAGCPSEGVSRLSEVQRGSAATDGIQLGRTVVPGDHRPGRPGSVSLTGSRIWTICSSVSSFSSRTMSIMVFCSRKARLTTSAALA